MRTRLTETFGIRYPVVCAPMALVTGGRLAAAVSAAGGLGILGGGYAGMLGGEPDLKHELQHVSGQKFGVGFITWALSRVPHVLDTVLSHKPFCVFLSFGDPRPFSDRIRSSGARLICQVQCLAHIRDALEAGAGAIVAQGTEAGGHGAKRSTLPFIPEAADFLEKHSPKTLLLGAGGIADGRGLAAALMLGADGVVVGTRFWATAEALTPIAATQSALHATGDDTLRTRALDSIRGLSWPEGFSFRVVKNKFTEEWADREDEAEAERGRLAAVYAQARQREDYDVVAIVAGECIGLIQDRPAAASVLQQMVSQAQSLLRRGATLDFA